MDTLTRKAFWTLAHGIDPEHPDDRSDPSAADLCDALYAHFQPAITPDEILVTLTDRRAAALDFSECTCEEGRSGCMDCWHRAESLIGGRVRDAHGREWTVEDVGEKDDNITISGEQHWAPFWDFQGAGDGAEPEGAALLALPEPEDESERAA